MILFKYTPPSSIDVLQEELIRFTQPLAFNDPFDSHPYVSDRGKAQETWERLSPDEKKDLGPEESNTTIEQALYNQWNGFEG